MKQEPRFTRQPIVVDPITGTTYLSTSDLGFNFDPGMRATVDALAEGGRWNLSISASFKETRPRLP